MSTGLSSVPERSEIDDKYKWDLESIYSNDQVWENAYHDVEKSLEKSRGYEGTIGERGGKNLLEVLELRDEIMREVSKIASYARMRSDEDTRDQDYQMMSTRGQSLSSQASSTASFIEPEIQELPREKVEEMVNEVEGLEKYDHYLDDVLRQKEHTRSKEVEEVLADLGEVLSAPANIFNMLTNADIEFPTVEGPDGEPVEVTQSNFTKLQKKADRNFRQLVYEEFYDELAKYRNTISTSLENAVKSYVKDAKIHGYDSSRKASLDGPNIPVSVYDSLVETVEDNLDILHRHSDLKREALGVDELKMWDIYMPVADSESPDLPYDEATEHVVEAVGVLGDDYQKRVEEGLESRWVDVYENEGKRAGAYSAGTYDTQPFILMNYQNDISSMYTLAHELGHSLHTQLTSEEQPYIYSGYETFVAEVASTVNESLLTHHLLDTVEDEEFRLHILNEYLERFRSTLYRQTMFAHFEQKVHEMVEEHGAIVADQLDETYREMKEEYYANADIDERIGREWMRIPHFYYGFYVFQYSTGISAAVALSDQILNDGDEAADRYIDFLKKGSSEYPLELLEGAGVDMSSSKPYEQAIDVYEGYLDEMESLAE